MPEELLISRMPFEKKETTDFLQVGVFDGKAVHHFQYDGPLTPGRYEVRLVKTHFGDIFWDDDDYALDEQDESLIDMEQEL